MYKDEPAIFAWELMNEPRCLSDVSGQTLQAWITEMAQFVKSIDGNHLLTVGLEGFYGPTTPEKFILNPGDWAQALGSDFIHNSRIETLDFASVHAYPDSWVPDTWKHKPGLYLQDITILCQIQRFIKTLLMTRL
jgi:mannan endo-1,4-beta-mannosidase